MGKSSKTRQEHDRTGAVHDFSPVVPQNDSRPLSQIVRDYSHNCAQLSSRCVFIALSKVQQCKHMRELLPHLTNAACSSRGSSFQIYDLLVKFEPSNGTIIFPLSNEKLRNTGVKGFYQLRGRVIVTTKRY